MHADRMLVGVLSARFRRLRRRVNERILVRVPSARVRRFLRHVCARMLVGVNIAIYKVLKHACARISAIITSSSTHTQYQACVCVDARGDSICKVSTIIQACTRADARGSPNDTPPSNVGILEP